MQLAHRVLQLKPSATLATATLAQELRASGREIISLSVGEPDFDTPDYISQAAIDAINEGFTKYTAVPGIMELRKAVSDYFNKSGAGSLPEHVIISNGGKHCLYNLFQSAINPGDEVLIPAPYWVSYPPMVELAGGVAVIVPSGVKKHFKVTPADLERHRTPKTRMCIINSPSNPTGATYTQAELDALAQWAVDTRTFMVSDEIYEQLIYAPAEHASICPWWRKHPDNFALINGVAKSYAMTGWRVGYMLAQHELIKACNKLQGQSSSNVCSIAQKAALAALTIETDSRELMRQAFLRRRNLAMEIINTWPGVTCPTPDGAFYLFPDMHELYTSNMPDSMTMCKALMDRAGVAMVPGEAFGDDNCLRLSYATDDETLAKALDRVGQVLFKNKSFG
ncbi:MAG: pyridoxal phosphate-dependent aminotransferase [Deltaproteobacteria bacterium]|jgi:aspartate aminotransferase|nr:pyridoxal phosphate-dependent aminotransferase [Deltaproteobacteria bacterium]